MDDESGKSTQKDDRTVIEMENLDKVDGIKQEAGFMVSCS